MGSNPRTHPAAAKVSQSRQLNRVNLFVLIRVLFHYLEKVDARLLVQAKQVLKDCDKRKKDGDPEFQSLAGSIESRIRATVGDLHWNKALTIQRQVLLNKQKQKVAAMQKKYDAKKKTFQKTELHPSMNTGMEGITTDNEKPLFLPKTISITKKNPPFIPVIDKSCFYSHTAAQAVFSPNPNAMTAMRPSKAESVASSDDGSLD